MSRKTYYKECPDCGLNLDPGERCECKDADRTLTPCEVLIPNKIAEKAHSIIEEKV